MPAFIDTHLHLDEDGFEPDRDEIVARALAAGVERMVSIGTTAETSRRAVAVAEKYTAVYAAVGIQPNYVSDVRPGDWDAVVQLAETHPKVVAIGETGLDLYWKAAPLDLQIEYFHKQIALARRLDKPFVVHMRACEAEVVAELRQAAADGPLHGIMHCFTGAQATADACLELGLHLSFAGMVTFKSNQALRDVALTVPLDRLLIETDAPYLAPNPHRGKRNEPSYVPFTAACLADLRGLPLDELAAKTTANAMRLFGWSATTGN